MEAPSTTPERAGTLSPLERSGKRSWAMQQWHAEKVNAFPTDLVHYDDVVTLFENHILPGHVPQHPLLSAEDDVITLGSCFADELRKFLDAAGFSSGSFWVPSGLNNTFALLDFVSWCASGRATTRAYRYERGDDGDIREWAPESERAVYEERFRAAGCFVFTLGLSEVWEDRETGGVFWRGVPQRIFDEQRHVFRLSTVDENEENIVDFIGRIREINDTAPIVLTLSPVPLRATFRDISCFSADAVSKSVLRVAIDRVMARELSNVFYWPSFELVKWAGPVLDFRAYDDPDARHANRYLVHTIVSAFVRAFYGDEALVRFRASIEAAGMAERRPHRVRSAVTRARRRTVGARARLSKRVGALRGASRA